MAATEVFGVALVLDRAHGGGKIKLTGAQFLGVRRVALHQMVRGQLAVALCKFV